MVLTDFIRFVFFFFQAEDGIRDRTVTGVQTCALPICFGGEEFQLTFDVRRERARHTKGTSGAAEGSRTPNLLITNQALCQLSYSGPLGRLYYGGKAEDLLKECDPTIQAVQHGLGDGGVGIAIQHGGAGEHDLAAGVAQTHRHDDQGTLPGAHFRHGVQSDICPLDKSLDRIDRRLRHDLQRRDRRGQAGRHASAMSTPGAQLHLRAGYQSVRFTTYGIKLQPGVHRALWVQGSRAHPDASRSTFHARANGGDRLFGSGPPCPQKEKPRITLRGLPINPYKPSSSFSARCGRPGDPPLPSSPRTATRRESESPR